MHNQAKEVPLAGIIILCKRPGDSDHKVFPCRSHFSLIFECVEIIIPAGRITGHCQIMHEIFGLTHFVRTLQIQIKDGV